MNVRTVALCVVSVAASPAFAAEVTDVADAADTVHIGTLERDDNFDLYFTGVDFEMTMENGKITREPIDRPGLDPSSTRDCVAKNARDCQPVDELRYKRNTNRYRINAEMGIFHDLSLTFGWSMVFSETMKFRYAKGVNAGNSTVDGTAFGKLFDHKFESQRGGLGKPGSGPFELGLKFAPLSDERDESKPSWVLKLNWASPWTQTTYNPAIRATKSNPGSVGDGVHRVTFATALSKRIANLGLIGINPNLARRGYIDPYMEFRYTLPVPQSGTKGALRDNIKTKGNPFGVPPSHEAHFDAGFEIVPLEDLRAGRKVALDLGLRSAFFTEGRNYSELSGPLGELTYTEQYMYVGGLLGLYVQAAEFIRIKAGVTVGTDTEHFLTNEDVGKDMNGDNQVLHPEDDSNNVKDQLNPNFCGNTPGDKCSSTASGGAGQLPYDQTGFRFKDEEHVLVGWFIQLMFTF